MEISDVYIIIGRRILVFCFTQVYLLWLLMLQTSANMMCNIFCFIFMCCFVVCSHFIILWSSSFSSLMLSLCSNCFGGVQIALTLFIVLLWVIVLLLATKCNCCPLCAFMFHSVFILLFWTSIIFCQIIVPTLLKYIFCNFFAFLCFFFFPSPWLG
jgi:hypothetical protein